MNELEKSPNIILHNDEFTPLIGAGGGRFRDP